MKFSTKLFLSVSVIISITLACFCTAAVRYNFRLSMQQAYDSALQELRTIQMSLQLAIHTQGEAETLEKLSDQLWQVSYGKRLGLYDGQGNLLYSNNAQRDLNRRKADLPEQTGETVSFHPGTDVGYYELTARSRFSVGEHEYCLVLIQSADSILERLDNQLSVFRYLYLTIIAVVLLVLFVFTRLFTKPVQTLASATRRLSQGQLDQRVSIQTEDEIGQLGQDFNRMAQSIQEKVDSLRREAENKDTFIANFAHEIKTPMTSILGYADLIYRTPEITPEVREASEYILNESLRLEALSHKLMELYVVDKQDFVFTEVFLPDFMDSLARTMAEALERKDAVLELSVEPVYLRVEEDLFSSLITNLVDNAVKAGANHLLLGGHWDGETYLVSLGDNGCGMGQQELAHITEAFYMADKARSRSQHGAGLGLALCEKIARLHHTTLAFASIKGVGTTVTLRMKGEKADEASSD